MRKDSERDRGFDEISRKIEENEEFNSWVTQELQDAHREVVDHRERIAQLEKTVERLEREVESTSKQLVDLGTRVRDIEEQWNEIQTELQLKWRKINRVRETLQEKGLWATTSE